MIKAFKQEKFMQQIRPEILLLFLFLSIFPSLVLSDDLNADNNMSSVIVNLTEKLDALKKGANQGDVDSQAELAIIYDNDFEKYGIESDLSQAFLLYESAAEQGHLNSQFLLAYIYDQEYQRFGIERDTKKALKLYILCAERGHAEAQYNLAIAYGYDYEDFGIEGDPKKAISLFTSSSEQSDLNAQYSLAYIYDQDYEAFGIERDTEKAFDLYTDAANKGVAGAQFQLGYIYDVDFEAFNLEMSVDHAISWYEEASKQDHLVAKNNLGLIYWYGQGVPRNQFLGRKLFIEASQLGDQDALENLARSLNENPKIDSKELDVFILRSKKQDNVNSPLDLWMVEKLLDQESLYFNPDQAIDTLTQMTLSKSIKDEFKSEAALKLSSLHSRGLYTEKNLEKAKDYIEIAKSKDIGSKSYGVALTDYLINQEGFTLNKETSNFVENYCLLGAKTEYFDVFVLQQLFQNQKLKEYRYEFIPKCFEVFVEKEVFDGHYGSAGETYFQGFKPHVMPNFKMAVELWEKSLKKYPDNSASMFSLGFMYANGLGVEKNIKKAKDLILQAKNLDHGPAYNYIGEALEFGNLGFKKNKKDALENYIKAQLLSPDDPLSKTNLARFYLKEDTVKAIALLDSAYNDDNYLEAGLELAKHIVNSKTISNPLEKALSILNTVKKGTNSYYLEVGPEKYDRTLKEAENLSKEIILALKSKLMPSLGDYHALIIGNSNYNNLQSLKTPKNDAERIATELQTNYGFKTELLLDANRFDILSALNRYRQELDPEDNFLIYYAGHGVIDETNEGYWQPVDAEPEDDSQWISNSRVNRMLQKFKSRNLLLISDSCFSGSQLRGVRISNDSALSFDVGEKEIIASKYNSDITRVALTSGELQPVPDSIGFSENSLFAESLINALKSNVEILFAEDLYKKVRDRVIPMAAQSGFDQSPNYGKLFSAGHNDGDFIFQKNAVQN
jgi:TPR repeat protein/uncharacterized caspase-like protein